MLHLALVGNIRSPSLRLINIVCPFSHFLSACRKRLVSLAALTLLSRRKADEKYLHIFVGLSVYIIIFLGSNKITML